MTPRRTQDRRVAAIAWMKSIKALIVLILLQSSVLFLMLGKIVAID